MSCAGSPPCWGFPPTWLSSASTMPPPAPEPARGGEDVRLRDVAFIAEHADAFPITVEERSQREYPYRALAAHVLGYVRGDSSLENQAAGRDVPPSTPSAAPG
ncbi:MAG: hypothetical protein ACLTEX_02740 [Eggerthella lenta]